MLRIFTFLPTIKVLMKLFKLSFSGTANLCLFINRISCLKSYPSISNPHSVPTFSFPRRWNLLKPNCLLSDQILFHTLLSVFSRGLYIHHLQEVSLPLFSVKSSFRFTVSFFRIQILCIIPWTKTKTSTQSPAMTSFQVTTSSRKTAQGKNPTSAEKWIWGGEINTWYLYK